jgi:predicted PurR-regulated permease PerM
LQKKDSAVTAEEPTHNRDQSHVSRALEASIHIGLLILLSVACLWILLPFLPLVAWGIILAIAGYPAYVKLQRIVGGSGWLAATSFMLCLFSLLIVPLVLLGGTLVEGTHALIAHLQDGTLAIPPPPPSIETWPIIGSSLKGVWSAASTNLTELLRPLAPQIRKVIPGLLAASASVGLAVLQFLLAILVAGALLAKSRDSIDVTRALFSRLFGNKGPEYEALVEATIRSVTTGILGVALIQSLLAGLSFLVVGLPGAGLWAMLFLFAAVLQVGVLVLIPAVVYAFTIVSTTKATIFLIWCIIVGLIDNVLKPLLLGRGASVPTAVIFLGAIGGFIGMGVIGLFVGAILLSVGYKLILAWMEGPAAARQQPDKVG